MNLTHFRPCQEAPLNSEVFLEDTDTQSSRSLQLGPTLKKKAFILHSTGSRRDILSDPVPSRPRDWSSRERKAGKVGKEAQSCSFPVPSDRISPSSPRVVDDTRARALCTDMKRCSYYETCATYGLNVDRVFQEGKCDDPKICEKQGARGLGQS